MRMSGCPCLTRRQFRRDPLTLSSQTKASLFWTILGRYWDAAEYGIAPLGTAAVMSGISRHSSEGNDALDGWGSAIRVRREKAALFQWVQGPPGDRSSRKQPEQAWRRRNV